MENYAIGIKSCLTKHINDAFFGQLKQYLLLYNSIGITSLKDLLMALEHSLDRHSNDNIDRYIAELIYLQKEGLIFDAGDINFIPKPEDETYYVKELEEFEEIKNLAEKSKTNQTLLDAFTRAAAIVFNHDIVNKNQFRHAFPILYDLNLPNVSTATKHQIYQIVVDEIPIPSPTTSWENIIDFKKDKNNIGRLYKLCNWITENTHSNDSIEIINSRYKEELFDLNNELNKYRIDTIGSVLNICLKTASDLIFRQDASTIPNAIIEIIKGERNYFTSEINANKLGHIFYVKSKFG